MSDVLEDPDGSPYPEEVQGLVTLLLHVVRFDIDIEHVLIPLVRALESVRGEGV